MKVAQFIFLVAFTTICCTNHEPRTESKGRSPAREETVAAPPANQHDEQASWTGTLNGKTPIFIAYQRDKNVIAGEIVYLNTPEKLPIKLLGTVEKDNSYRLLEFDNKGNITGVIEGTPAEKVFTGSWVSPKTKKELQMNLVRKDTLLSTPSIKADVNAIFGGYHYQYGTTGYNGNFECTKVGEGKLAFNILSLTNVERGPNVAEVKKDTINFSGNDFIYKIPGTDDCEFQVSFYKGFVYINYTKGYCESQFGLNATVDGIYLKID